MSRTNFDQLLEAGCHFGHMKRKWNPAMAPYIFMERNGIHIIDLHKTVVKIDEAAEAMKQIARSGKRILFVATKKQAKDIIAEKATSVGMPFVNERWPGGMLTNFATIRKAVKKMATIDKMVEEGTFANLSKRELLQITRQRAKLEKNLGSIADLTRLPSAVFVVDVMKENIAVHEANRLGIPVFGIVDTNSDPRNIDFVIPANDDATKSVEVILNALCAAIVEGLEERKVEKADAEAAEAQAEAEAEEAAEAKTRRRRTRTRIEDVVPAKEEAPAEEAAPVKEEAPAEEAAPVKEEAPVEEEAPKKKAPAKKAAKKEEAPAEEAPKKKAPAKKATTKKAAAKEEAPAEDAPAAE
ncbi:MAG: 30S ribosomal protein S2 [Bacteroidaceae bacterium]|nr:30S ribosomal protein S2 [Bacteroidaceae bacterium]